MVTEIAAATGELLKLINNQASTAQQRRISDAVTQANKDVTQFKQALLDGLVDRINLQLGGLRHGILVRLTEGESRDLGLLRPEIDGNTLLALYARARCADLTADVGAIAGALATSANP